MNRKGSRLLLASTLFFTANAQAGGPLLWQNKGLTYLYGSNFRVQEPIQQTVTFEHTSGWAWGDAFLVVDNKWFDGASGNAGHTYYGEFSPRLSLGKIIGRDLSFGPIKDVLIAASYERGENRNRNYLLGPAVDLNAPGFDRFSINSYYRKPDGITGRAGGQWQITPTWAIKIPVGKSNILIEGYIDWVVNDASSKAKGDFRAKNLHINPQIKYDLGKALDWGDRKFT